MVIFFPAHQHTGGSEEILGGKRMKSSMAGQSELPERENFLSWSVFWLQKATWNSRSLSSGGRIFLHLISPVSQTHPYFPACLGIQDGPSTPRSNLQCPPSSLLLPPIPLPSFSSPTQLLKPVHILSETNCFSDLLHWEAFLPTWYVQWLWRQWPVLRGCYLKPRVQPAWCRTPERG